MVTGLWYTHVPNSGSILILKVQRISRNQLSGFLFGSKICYLMWSTFKSWFWALMEAWGSWWGFYTWFLFWYGHWSLIRPYFEDCLSIFILKVQRTSMSFKSSFQALEDAGGSWLGFGMLIFIWILSLVSGAPIFLIFALYLDLKVQKTSMSLSPDLGLWRRLEVPDWGSASGPWFGMWTLAFDTPDPNIGSLSLLWRCKEHPCP